MIVRGLKCLRGSDLESPGPVLLEAFPAVNRPTFGRLERNLGLNSTVGADRVVHFSGFAAVTALPSVSVHSYYLQPKRSY